MKNRDHLLQNLISLKEIKPSIGQANYYPNLVIVPDTSHIKYAEILMHPMSARSIKNNILQGDKVFLLPILGVNDYTKQNPKRVPISPTSTSAVSGVRSGM
jgi:hypothetical protein